MIQDSSAPRTSSSPWAPFRERAFAWVWLATVVSNVGGRMYDVAAGWLMVRLDSDPLIVSMVQVANALPMVLFAIPAGVLVDRVDQRRLLIYGEFAILGTSLLFALLVWLQHVTPASLLMLSFLGVIGTAVTAPAWQAIVRLLVPKESLAAAIAANSVGINISRAIGPAIGGLLVVSWGIAAPFWLNALSNVGVLAVLVWWRAPGKTADSLPHEPFLEGLRVGLRHARYNANLSATLVHALAFFSFASAYWALLPLIVSDRLRGGPGLYGVLLGAIGTGAIGSVFFLSRLKGWIGPDRLLTLASVLTAAAMMLFGMAHHPALAILASIVAGVSWVAAVSGLNISAQVALPTWVRGRGLAIYVTVMFMALTIGSFIWGRIAGWLDLSTALILAAIGGIVVIPLTWGRKLQQGSHLDLTPSMKWTHPIGLEPSFISRGPVLVTLEYRIDPRNRDAFLQAMLPASRERLRDGAFQWEIFEDPSAPGRYIETFRLESWLEHLRQHERVTVSDQISSDAVRRFHLGAGPETTHWLAALHPDGPNKTVQ